MKPFFWSPTKKNKAPQIWPSPIPEESYAIYTDPDTHLKEDLPSTPIRTPNSNPFQTKSNSPNKRKSPFGTLFANESSSPQKYITSPITPMRSAPVANENSSPPTNQPHNNNNNRNSEQSTYLEQELNHCLEFKDVFKRLAFEHFCEERFQQQLSLFYQQHWQHKTPPVFLCCYLAWICLFLPIQVLHVVELFQHQSPVYIHRSVYLITCLLTLLFTIFSSIIGVTVFSAAYHSNVMKYFPSCCTTNNFVYSFFVTAVQCSFIFLFISRMVTISKYSTDEITFSDFIGGNVHISSTIESTSNFIITQSLMLFCIPTVIFSYMPYKPMMWIWLNYLLSCGVFITAVVLFQNWGSLPLGVCWMCFAGMMLRESQMQHIQLFLMQTLSPLTSTIINDKDPFSSPKANEIATEMRHMIANVAHDLKTPLSSFNAGIELIQMTLDELIDGKQSSNSETFKFLQSCLHNIRNTNSFMLMTINRCFDYTKASKGLKLVPRYETIDLMETLQLPLSCMQNIQNRIEIRLKEVSDEICSHIITDKQWLQENVLCLLSNAVKYSSEGVVSISVRMEEKEFIVNSMKADVFHPSTKLNVTDFLSFDENKDDNKVKQVIMNIANKFDLAKHMDQSPQSVNSDTTKEGIPGYDSKIANSCSTKNGAYYDVRKAKSSSEKINAHLLFEIEDTGIGMTDEAMRTLFNPFKQNQRLAGGTGLGLYSLAKRVEALKGEYGVRRRYDGKQGSLFWFSIPYRADHVASMKVDITPPKVNAEMEGMIEEIKYQIPKMNLGEGLIPPNVSINTSVNINVGSSVVPFNCSLTLTPKRGSRSRRSSKVDTLPGYNILIADDSPSIVKMTTLMLKKLGHKVTSAENGEVALKLITSKWEESRERFDVVLMDLQMPVMDGLEAMRRIRAYEVMSETKCKKLKSQRIKIKQPVADGEITTANVTPSKDDEDPNDVTEIKQDGVGKEQDDVFDAEEVPFPHQLIIGLSANSDYDTMEEAKVAGVDAFLPKPFNVASFNETMQSILKPNMV